MKRWNTMLFALAVACAASPMHAIHAQQMNDLGKTIFAARCAVCHQADGRGMDGLAPPLTDYPARYVTVAPGRKQLIQTVLNGMYGDVAVGAKHYNFRMPSFASLSDSDIANVLNYVAFDLAAKKGSKALPLRPEDVHALRAEALDGEQVRQRRNAFLPSLGL
ncbi:c-type cytochrome [Paraburkholderia megapolitana]|uniref:Cytochrome c553 n=1 Tax=Paraburkholderia megapolitana TaxID=420953 RepID=A0A1I3FQ26_9BURK|nr:Cytochrome c553 [Paraburkholderia megapolitana]